MKDAEPVTLSQTNDAQRLCLVLGCDDRFARPLGVALFSALAHFDKAQAARIFVIDGGISAQSKERLERIVRRVRPDLRIHWIAPGTESMLGLEGARHLSPAAYLRLFIPALVPAEITRVLYLDCDILVRGNLADLWRVNLEGKPVGAVRDFAVSEIAHLFSGVKDYREIGVDPAAAYFNSGLLLIDVARWRTGKVAADALAYAVKYGGALPNCDQDALNAVLSGEWLPLDYRWNVQYALLHLHDLPPSAFARELLPLRPALLKEAEIVHFTGALKPWNHWYGHPAAEEWVRSLLRSGWFAPAEAARWAAAYWAKRAVFKLKVALRLHSLPERVN